MPLDPRPVNFASCENAQYGEQNILTVHHADTIHSTTVEHVDTLVIPGSNNTIIVQQANQVIVGGHNNTIHSNSEDVEVVGSEEENPRGEEEDNGSKTDVVFGLTDVTTESDVDDWHGVRVQVGDQVWIAHRQVFFLHLGFYVGGGHVVIVLDGEHEVKQINVSGHPEFTISKTYGHLSSRYSRTEICGRCSERLGHRYNNSVEFVRDVRGF